VIKTFKCRDTEALFDGARVPRFANFAAVAIRKLQMLYAATRIESLRVPPQNRLEKLSGQSLLALGSGASASTTSSASASPGATGRPGDVEIVDYH